MKEIKFCKIIKSKIQFNSFLHWQMNDLRVNTHFFCFGTQCFVILNTSHNKNEMFEAASSSRQNPLYTFIKKLFLRFYSFQRRRFIRGIAVEWQATRGFLKM